MALDPSVLQTQHMNGGNTGATASTWQISDSKTLDTLDKYAGSMSSVKSGGSATNRSGNTPSTDYPKKSYSYSTGGNDEDEHASCRRKQEQLQDQINELEAENKDLTQKNEQLEADKAQLENQVAQLTATKEQLEQTVSTLESKVSNLQSKINKQGEYKDDFDPSMDAAAEQYNNAEFGKTTEENVNNSTIENPNDNGDAVTTATEDTNTGNRLSNSFSRLGYTLGSNNTNTDTAKTTTSEVVNPVDNVNKTFDVILNEGGTVNDMKAKAQQAFDQAKEELKQSVNSKEEYVQLLNQLKQHPLFKAIQ